MTALFFLDTNSEDLLEKWKRVVCGLGVPCPLFDVIGPLSRGHVSIGDSMSTDIPPHLFGGAALCPRFDEGKALGDQLFVAPVSERRFGRGHAATNIGILFRDPPSRDGAGSF